mgnify:CR=1 FL=1
METKLIEKEAVQAKFEVTIPAAEVDKAYATVLRSVARQVRVLHRELLDELRPPRALAAEPVDEGSVADDEFICHIPNVR